MTTKQQEENRAAAPQEYLLEMRGICKAFAGVQALKGVDFYVRPGTVHALAGALLHPLNRPRVENGARRGYAIVQPNMELSASAVKNGFIRLFAGRGGMDGYPVTVSELYQDVTGHGTFGGKGVYDVRAFMAAVEGKLPEGRIRWRLSAAAPQGARLVISYQGKPIAEGDTGEDGCGSALLPPEALYLWTPETPALYDVSITLGEDHVQSYFAMRTVGTGRDAAGHPCLLLNGRPYFHHGVLDQGYWPDGLYTAPSDEALIYDIQLMKRLGFNMLRKHIKIEPMRWYYHCDRLGMLVWQDMPNGGGKYDLLAISAPLITRRHKKDNDYKRFARTDAAGRAEYYAGLDEMVRQLYNCPSVVMWVPFNEGWGQFDAAEAVRRIRALDQTRTIDHASGWHDQGAGDVQSLHVYFYQYRFRPDKRGRAVVLSEFGGYNLPLAGHTWNDANFGYRGYKTPEALEAAYRKLYETQIIPAKEKGLAACVYTQLSDVEDEVNGLVTYDRRAVKLPVSAPFALNAQLKRE